MRTAHRHPGQAQDTRQACPCRMPPAGLTVTSVTPTRAGFTRTGWRAIGSRAGFPENGTLSSCWKTRL